MFLKYIIYLFIYFDLYKVCITLKKTARIYKGCIKGARGAFTIPSDIF